MAKICMDYFQLAGEREQAHKHVCVLVNSLVSIYHSVTSVG